VDALDAGGAEDAPAIDLVALGIAAGDFIKLEQFGGIQIGTLFVDGDPSMVGVFSSTNALGPETDLNRVTGAIDAGVDVITGPTYFLGDPTDIAEDFRINPSVIVQVPVGANYLFIAALDASYSDNTDPNGDFAVRISKVPDLSIWVGKWFKVTVTLSGFHFADLDAKPTPPYRISDSFPAYLKIGSWGGNGVLQTIVYTKDQTGNWDPANPVLMDFYYFAGSQLNFVCSSEVDTGNSQFGFTIRFKGVRNKAGNFVLGGDTFLATSGAHYVEVDDVPNSTERWAGSLKLGGNMIPESKVPPVLLGR
jgi:hypothetical protein